MKHLYFWYSGIHIHQVDVGVYCVYVYVRTPVVFCFVFPKNLKKMNSSNLQIWTQIFIFIVRSINISKLFEFCLLFEHTRQINKHKKMKLNPNFWHIYAFCAHTKKTEVFAMYWTISDTNCKTIFGVHVSIVVYNIVIESCWR